MIKHKTDSRFNRLIIIHNPIDNELNTGAEIEQYTEFLSIEYSFIKTYHKIYSKECLVKLLQEIAEKCSNAEIYPILHFDLHGDENKKGLIITSKDNKNEFIDWNEFTDLCRKINILTNNNLIIVLASCNGYHAITNVDIKLPTPYYLLIGSPRPISAGYINERFPKFYNSLFKSNNIYEAIEFIKDMFIQYHCEKLLLECYAKYYLDSCIGKNRNKRVNKIIKKFNIKNREKVKKLKKKLKHQISKLSNQKFEFNKTTFLMSNNADNISRFTSSIKELFEEIEKIKSQ